jgi:alpha-beta hydrolase superfamily lysophospholipase
MLKKINIGLIIFIGLLITIFSIGNNYQMKEEIITIPIKEEILSAVLTLPKRHEPKGVIVFVHGDGAQEATQNGGYKPLMERFAKQGYASISWDKPGVGHSTGNWLNQSMADRADEVEEVIEWTKKAYPKLTKKVGLWGASQAGWVIPKVISKDKDIEFVIIVGPAINWIHQGEYDTVWQVRKSGGLKEEVDQAKKNFINDSKIIENNVSYDQYKKNGGQVEMSSDRYLFIRKNMDADVTNELDRIKTKIFLILAENDKNVNSSETKKIYLEKISNKYLKVKTIPNTEHQMINPQIADSNFLINIIGLIAPKFFLISEDYLGYCEGIVSNQ